MDIYLSMFDIWDKYGNLINEVRQILNDESLRIDDYWSVFEERKGLTFFEISKRLKNKGITFKEEDLFVVLEILLSNEQCIVRNEYWHHETEWKYLDKYYWGHKNQQYHYSFTDDMLSSKNFLLIADTHIGNDKIFNAKLLNNIYDYAIKNGATKCFHLGDLFEGLPALVGDEYTFDNIQKKIRASKEEFDRQLNIFINEYPHPFPSELKTYSIIGNHDETMNRFLKWQSCFQTSDLRKLSIYNPSFYMFPNASWYTKLNEREFHFNHRLYMSSIINDLKISEINDIEKKKDKVGDLILSFHYDIFISGHLHQGLIYSSTDFFKQKYNLYLGVPSTSNLNISKAVGYLVYMYPETDSMEISILGCDNNLNIFQIDRMNWNFNKKNKSYCKVL